MKALIMHRSLALVLLGLSTTDALGHWLRGFNAKEAEQAAASRKDERRAVEYTLVDPYESNDKSKDVQESEVAFTSFPTKTPTPAPTAAATTSTPTAAPTTLSPSTSPSLVPTSSPTSEPTAAPSTSPSASPSESPNATPSESPSASPSAAPSVSPSESPSNSVAETSATESPSTETAVDVTVAPTEAPQSNETTTAAPTEAPQSNETTTFAPTTSNKTDQVRVDMTPEIAEGTAADEEAEDPDVVPSTATSVPTSIPTSSPSSTPGEVSTGALAVAQDVGAGATASAATGSTAGSGQTKYYEGFQWDDLPMNAKAAAMTLGFDEQKWNAKERVETSSMKFSDLTAEERMSVIILGYTQEAWNANTVVVTDTSTSVAMPSPPSIAPTEGSLGGSSFFSGGVVDPQPTNVALLEWDELPDAGKSSAQLLGYNQITWDNDFPVFSSYLYWHQLTQGQKDAVAVLGYSDSSWDSDVIPSVNPFEQEQVLTEGDALSGEVAADEEVLEVPTEVMPVPIEGGAMAETEVQEPVAGPFTTSEANRPERKPKKGEDEPDNAVADDTEMEMQKLENEVEALKKDLQEAMDVLKQHESVLKVLQGLPDDATISSVQGVVQLNGGRRKRGDNKPEKEDEEEDELFAVGKKQNVQPVATVAEMQAEVEEDQPEGKQGRGRARARARARAPKGRTGQLKGATNSEGGKVARTFWEQLDDEQEEISVENEDPDVDELFPVYTYGSSWNTGWRKGGDRN